MKTKLVKIGNSQGFRVPKSLLEQTKIKGNVKIVPKGDGLLILPSKDVVNNSKLSEVTLGKDWLRKEEEEAWAHLQ
jgi:antitoxin component of MazEF toxin-antitoxin module